MKTPTEYLAAIGRRGGKKGGKATGEKKRRSPEHYSKMVVARQQQRKNMMRNVTVERSQLTDAMGRPVWIVCVDGKTVCHDGAAWPKNLPVQFTTRAAAVRYIKQRKGEQ